MKTLMTALTLGALLAAPAFAQSASAQRPGNNAGTARAQAIQECSLMNKRDSHDPYGASGGLLHHYRACMASQGQPE